ncbi:MAG: hypothetical protein ACRCS9_15275 [Hyphomicrobium sp.]
MLFVIYSLLAAFGMFATSIGFQQIGRRFGARSGEQRTDAVAFAAIETAVFGLLGLLVAFTFSGAVSRFDERRQSIAEEANAIGAAYGNLDLLPADTRANMKKLFQDYLATRLEQSRLAHGLFEEVLPNELSARSASLYKDIWDSAANASRAPGQGDIAQVLLPSINNMFAVARSRNALAHRHPPMIVYIVLFAFAAAASLLAGHAMAAQGKSNSLHALCFAGALALAVFLILEIEFPRQGFVRLDAYDAVLANILNERN